MPVGIYNISTIVFDIKKPKQEWQGPEWLTYKKRGDAPQCATEDR